jgi:hypothetical protein
MQLLQFLSDHPAVMSQIVSYAVASFVFIAHHRYCDGQHADLGNRLTAIETAQPPNVEEILQMYNTADATLTAVNKLLRGQGRTIQARAAALAAAPIEVVPPPVKKTRFVGGEGRISGGLITTPKVEN